MQRPGPCQPGFKGGGQAGVMCRGEVRASVLPSTGLGAHLAPPLLSSFENSPLPVSLLRDSTRREKG